VLYQANREGHAAGKRSSRVSRLTVNGTTTYTVVQSVLDVSSSDPYGIGNGIYGIDVHLAEQIAQNCTFVPLNILTRAYI